ncbi:response regulator transcription factor [Flavicella marina]|uniref:response regulator transcription factor n=1 Tax=Flavicella marina TaxID=1475951 RepID=UPI001264D1F7|nr:LuxR C-terminal-related transcriptional regulator [Flavicella marina]
MDIQNAPKIQSVVTEKPIDIHSDEYQHYEKIIPKFPNQAVYIYSFKEKRMVYACGWKEVLGYEDTEVNMLLMVNSAVPEYAQSLNELNNKAWYFLSTKKERLEEYSFTFEIQRFHKEGHAVPIFSRVGVYKSVNGEIEQVIGISQIVPSLKFGKVMQFATYGPEKEEFEESLNKDIFHHFAISRKEKEALQLASKGFAFKEIADKLGVSQSAIEKRIIPMYKRFKVKSLTHLISFAYDNHILP